jgi:hypothetical protein
VEAHSLLQLAKEHSARSRQYWSRSWGLTQTHEQSVWGEAGALSLGALAASATAPKRMGLERPFVDKKGGVRHRSGGLLRRWLASAALSFSRPTA